MKIYHWAAGWGYLFWNIVLPPTSKSVPLPPSAAAFHHPVRSWAQDWGMFSKSQPPVECQVVKVEHFRNRSQQINKKRKRPSKKRNQDDSWNNLCPVQNNNNNNKYTVGSSKCKTKIGTRGNHLCFSWPTTVQTWCCLVPCTKSSLKMPATSLWMALALCPKGNHFFPKFSHLL